MSEDIADVLKSFNRKERYWVVQNAFGEQVACLCPKFWEELSKTFGERISHLERRSVWWAIDFHFDWLIGALHVYSAGEKGGYAPRENRLRPGGDLMIQGQQEDIDLVLASGRDVILIEANVGILLGQSSSWLVDIDLDSKEAVNFADRFLPPTGAIFGRTSKLRSHRLYYCRGVTTVPFQDPIDKKMIVEIRSGPGPVQTIFPPSIHPSGEKITWDAFEEPAHVEPQELRRCVSLLASYCLFVRYLPSYQAPLGDASADSWPFEKLPPEIRAAAIEWAGVPGRRTQPPIGEIQPMPTHIYVTLDPADKPTAMDKIAQVDAVQRYIEQAGYRIKRPAPYHLKYGRISYFPTKMKIMFDGDPKPRFGQSQDDFLHLIRDKRT